MLDHYGEDGFQSCEGFDDWSTFSSADWTEPQQNKPQDKTRKEELSTIPVTETGTFEFPENVCCAVLQIFLWLQTLNLFIFLEVEYFQTSVIVIFNTFVLQAENGNKVNPWFIFNDCFQVEEKEKNPVMMEIPTLSQLQQNTLDKPSQSAAISRYKSTAFATVHYEIMKPNCGEMLCTMPKLLLE